METTVVTCNCKVCNGMSARMRGAGTVAGKKATPTAIHNIVRMAHSPLARSASAQQFGPWPV